MNDLCGSSENLLSLVNYTLRQGGYHNDDDDNAVCTSATTSIKQIAMSKDSSSARDSSTPESRQEKHDDGNESDDNPSEGDNNNDNEKEGETPKEGDNNAKDGDEINNEDDKDAIAPLSDLSDVNRRIYVVTTAGLPWRTGTAVNPLARALYLTRGRPKYYVTLMIPWLEKKEEQAKVYGDTSFDSTEEQAAWIRKYSEERVGCKEEAANLQIRFYSALYHEMFGSIFATVDICSVIPQEEADIAILEEPEHLTWFRCLPPKLEESENLKDINKEDSEAREKALIGWTAKFNYIVGILHTNYSAYMRQYGLGASLVTASALGGLSSLVVRAYTHRLIRLSDTLPELDKSKEVTCNVHGVRSEFFDPPQHPGKSQNHDDDNDDGIPPQPIYFIGKVIWAKGFDKLLEIQDLYKKEIGEYFSLDVYGSGPDSSAIKRAFFGRNGVSSLSKKCSSGSLKDDDARSPREGSKSPSITAEDQTAAMVFRRDGSLRLQVEEGQAFPQDSLVVEVQTCETPIHNEVGTPSSASSVPPQNPQGVIRHLGEQTLQTGSNVSKAISTLSEKLTNLGLRVAFSEHEPRDSEDEKEEGKYFFDPPRSRYELRRYPIPARFLGTKDHALLRDIPEHKIFINLSITEVLCTTTAEALAMGKFAIIPKHPSNTFFVQFKNCLAFESKKECVEKVKWALENVPEPLSPEERHQLTWEGANQRLFKSSEMSEKQAEVMNKKTAEFAKMHMDAIKTGFFFKDFLAGRNKQKKKPDKTAD
ncbi:hypothetical protein IV203_026356 [Nitzschia inconspicua]|uniref:Digalactosyldiacylglycerol synthase n=1 Tax=Nitzschia inconspicua TaxID=303405 RepID=A0A9K3PXH0_9STRA|nr:hypothetical protein IV203_026356 [Nitzschia inconspicua]